jgi:glycine dehydrogenase subunit 1
MCRERKRTKTLISGALAPDVIETVKTYCWAADTACEIIPVKDGATDLKKLKAMLDETVGGVILAQPNFYGLIEDTTRAGEIIRAAGAKYILSVNPIAAALLKTPAECGADVAVGEGQPLGLPLSFGGPYLGFMAATAAMTRKLPGRIVGQTADAEGRRAFVLTAGARTAHPPRKGLVEHLLESGVVCADRRRLYGGHGAPGPARGRQPEHGKGALPGRAA